MATNYRKKVMNIVADNDLTVECACRNCISIGYPLHKQDKINNFHGIFLCNLRRDEITMAQAWEAVYYDLEKGVQDCPADCDCRNEVGA
jgi:hypothetical protein